MGATGLPRWLVQEIDTAQRRAKGSLPLFQPIPRSPRRQRGNRSIFELRVIRPDGERRTQQVTAAPQSEECDLIGENVTLVRSLLNSRELADGIFPGASAGHSNHPVDWGADFMAHHGQKLALGPVRTRRVVPRRRPLSDLHFQHLILTIAIT